MERAASHMAMAALFLGARVQVPRMALGRAFRSSVATPACCRDRFLPGGLLSVPIPGQGAIPSCQPFFLPNESFSVVTRLNTGLSAVWSKRSAT